jgi:hypothetical protein
VSHTPGPWHVSHGDQVVSGPHSGPGYASGGTEVADVLTDNVFDLNLIAAALDLLDALKGLYRGDCFCEMAIDNPMLSGHTAACKNAVAAIAKAEGRQ